MKRVFGIVLAALLGGASLPAQENALYQRNRVPLVESRSYGTNTYSSCVTLGEGASPVGNWSLGRGRARTTGSSTTVTAFTTGNDTFTLPNAGDSIRFLGGGQAKPPLDGDSYRQIATNADNNTITVNRAVNLDPTESGADVRGYPFVYRTLSCATGAGVGYVPVGDFKAGNFLLIAESESSATSGIDYQVEAYVEGAANDPQLLASGNIAQGVISSGGPAAFVNLGQFDFGTFGWTHARVNVKVAAGSVVYSVYLVVKN